MENVKLIFCSTVIETELELFANDRNEIFISITSEEYPPNFVTLNRHTAIKLSKELRKQIASLSKEDE